MIIDRRTKSNNYIEFLKNCDISGYICPKCRAKKSMTRHAYYDRNIITVENDEFFIQL